MFVLFIIIVSITTWITYNSIMCTVIPVPPD